MKRYIKYICAVIASGAALLSCARQESDTAFTGRKITFTSSLGTFQVKATDTAFEDGDQVGVFALGTTQFLNMKLTSQGGALVSETPLYWSERQGENEYNSFIAYYPYAPGVEDGQEYSIDFTVQPDQSTHANQTASDLMIANTQAAPSGGPVHFNFTHKLSKVVLYIDNQLDSEISEVYMGNLLGRVKAGVDAYAAEAYGDRGIIKAGKVSVNGAEAWSLIVVPQKAYPVLMITTVDGKQYTYNVEEEVSFVSARRYNALVAINDNTISTDFTAEITDWIDDADIQFGQGGSEPQPVENGAWAIVGDIPGAYTWSRDLWLDYIEDGSYFGYINYIEGCSFKFRMNGDWNQGDLGYGSVEKLIDGEPIQLADGGSNITLPQSGLYFIALDANKKQMMVEPAGYNNCPWSVIGLGNKWEVGDDIFMEPDYVFVDGEALPGFKAANMHQLYTPGDRFKFRFLAGWKLDYGLYPDNNTVSQANTWNYLVRGGADIFLENMPEYYDIIFNWYDRSFMVKTYGDDPQPSEFDSIADVLNGNDGDEFKVKAYVNDIWNLNYGNYYIIDSNNDVLFIYGTVNAQGKYPKDSGGWFTQDFGLVIGDEVVVNGKKVTANGTVELKDVTVTLINQVPIGVTYLSQYVTGNGGTVSNFVRSSSAPTLRLNESWVSSNGLVEIDGKDGWFIVDITAEANPDTENERWSQISIINEEGYYAQSYIEQGMGTKQMDGLQDVVESDDNSTVGFTSIVHAITTKGFVVSDGKYSILVYAAGTPRCKVGDAVKVSGVKTTYNHVPEISNTGLQYEVISSGNSLYELYYQEVTSDMIGTGGIANIAIPILCKGQLLKNSSNVYSVKVPGANVTMQLYYPSPAPDSALLNQNVIVKGFYNGYKSNNAGSIDYESIIVTSVELDQ